MIDARREAILVRSKEPPGDYVDKTQEIREYRQGPNGVRLTYNGSGKSYNWSTQRVAIARNLTRHQPKRGERLEVRGRLWHGTPEAYRFQAVGRTWWRIFWTAEGKDKYATYQDSDVRPVHDAAHQPKAADILAYWRDLVDHLPDKDDPLRRPYKDLDFVHPDSALARYLGGEPIPAADRDAPTIFPFSCNLSQRVAVQNALRYPISVIDGPPGTGKTQTILNLIANLVGSSKATVGIVSFNNAAVDNVREKLTSQGFGYMIAALGSRERTEAFFSVRKQSDRKGEIERLRAQPPLPSPATDQIADLDRRLARLQETEWRAAELRRQIDAYQLELRHFAQYVDQRELPGLDDLPLLRRHPDRIVDYLVDTELDRIDSNSAKKLLRRIRRYFAYGSTRRIDPDDTAVILRLQQAYYERTLVDLRRQLDQCDSELTRSDFAGLAESHRRLSIQALRAALQQRYSQVSPVIFSRDNYKRKLTTFTEHFPVILSTCHSIRDNLDRQLLDYLIIDEASQANLLAAGLALACARNVVVVGDLRQIEHIADKAACDRSMPAPAPAYDYSKYNILSSLNEVYGDQLPRTMLREHYRCDPAIIEFCNKKFYDGQLIPFTTTDPAAQPLTVYRTAEGNHMRRHHDGARSNQREIDVITDEVIPTLCKGTDHKDIGVTTPYRRQADKAGDVLDSAIQADTVHKFQGREKQIVIITTVLDETWRGNTGLKFVDDPNLVNVAVSRAVRKFILVTNHDLLSKSHNIRDLIGYIRYHDPDREVMNSTVVSIFDLLYREYSARLEPIARRIEGKMKYKSEEITSIVLHELLADSRYRGHHVVSQVWLRNLIPNLENLRDEQARYARHPRTSVDFVIYNSVTMSPLLAIEVDGFAFHENKPDQQVRDALKDAICETHGLPLLRLPTTGSQEQEKVRDTLDRLLQIPPGGANPTHSQGLARS